LNVFRALHTIVGVAVLIALVPAGEADLCRAACRAPTDAATPEGALTDIASAACCGLCDMV